jgi:hypothetical protein
VTHIMLDIETLGTRPGAVVLSAALVRFSDEAHCTVNLSVPDQEALGLEQDPSTVAWWQTQPPAAWEAATASPVALVTALPYLASWIAWAAPAGDALIWCHGATFDAPLLGEVFRRAGLPPPWNFWAVRCTRTLYDLASVDLKAHRVGEPHVALNDALGQTRAANAALVILAARRGL